MLLGTQRVNVRGHLEIGGCDTLDLAREFGTPLYVMDEAYIRQRCRDLRAAYAKAVSGFPHAVRGQVIHKHGHLPHYG